MSARVGLLLRAAYCNLYFDSHRHSVQFGHIFRRGLHNILSEPAEGPLVSPDWGRGDCSGSHANHEKFFSLKNIFKI